MSKRCTEHEVLAGDVTNGKDETYRTLWWDLVSTRTKLGWTCPAKFLFFLLWGTDEGSTEKIKKHKKTRLTTVTLTRVEKCQGA